MEQGILTRILTAVGGSEASLGAFTYALDLAQATGCVPEVLIVEEELVTAGMALAGGETLGRLVERLADVVRQHAEQTERGVRKLAAQRKLTVTVTRASGHVGDCVVAAAQQASLLVLGRQGQKATRTGLLGSNAESIVRRTHRPLLLAPVRHQPVGRVLVAYDGKGLAASALAMGLEVAAALKVPLEVLTVAPTEADGAALQEQARQSQVPGGPQLDFAVESGEPAAVILARCLPDTLVVLGAHGHARLYYMVLGSVSERVMRFAPGPVLLSAKQAPPADA